MRESFPFKFRVLILRAGRCLAVTVVLSLLWGTSGHGDELRHDSMVDEPSDATPRLVDRGENATGDEPWGEAPRHYGHETTGHALVSRSPTAPPTAPLHRMTVSTCFAMTGVESR